MIITEVLMILTLIICISITIFKILNIMSFGEDSKVELPILLFIIYCFSWLIGFVSLLSNPTEMILVSLFEIESFLFKIVAIITGIEAILLIKLAVSKNGREKYKPTD